VACRSVHVQVNASRVASLILRPFGNSIYRRTTGPHASSTYFVPIGKRLGRRVERRIVSPLNPFAIPIHFTRGAAMRSLCDKIAVIHAVQLPRG